MNNIFRLILIIFFFEFINDAYSQPFIYYREPIPDSLIQNQSHILRLNLVNNSVDQFSNYFGDFFDLVIDPDEKYLHISEVYRGQVIYDCIDTSRTIELGYKDEITTLILYLDPQNYLYKFCKSYNTFAGRISKINLLFNL